MKRNTTVTNSEKYRFRTLTGYDEIIIHLSASAGKWLAGTTRTNDGSYISHSTLLWDLVSRMSLKASVSKGFRHTLHLSPGMAQYSELQLQAEWGMGRKVIRRLLAQMEKVGLMKVAPSVGSDSSPFPSSRDGASVGRKSSSRIPTTSSTARLTWNRKRAYERGRYANWLFPYRNTAVRFRQKPEIKVWFIMFFTERDMPR